MASVFMPWGKQRLSIGASVTRETPTANGFGMHFTGGDNLYTMGLPGVLSKLYHRIATNDRGASTIFVRKNGANGNQNLSIGASSTGEFEDNVNTDSVANGDEFNLQIITGAGGTTFIASAGSIVFTATTNTGIRYQTTDLPTLSAASTTSFFVLGGAGSTAEATEGDATVEMETAGTFKYFGIRVGTNTRSTSTECGLRINGADSTSKVTVSASTTGTFVDTTGTDTIAIGDDVCFYIRTGTGTGNFGAQAGLWVDLETTNDKWQIMAGQSGGNSQSTFNANTVTYSPVGGVVTSSYTTESEAQIEPQLAFTASFLQVRVKSNTVTASSTVKLRKNGADTACVVTIPSSTTGLIVDSTNSAAIGADDDICYQVSTGATGTSLNISVISLLCATAVSAAPRFGRVVRAIGAVRSR